MLAKIAFLTSVTLVIGCGGSTNGSNGGGGDGGGGGSSPSGSGAGAGKSTGSSQPSGGGTAADVAGKLGLEKNFLIGMGNDLASDHSMDGAYTLGQKLDLHYCYLVGLPGKGGWPDWNANGGFVDIMADSANAKGVVPFFTMYMMASDGDGNLAGLSDDTFMGPYWDAAKLLFQRLAVFDKPAVVHVEPDFWGYAEQQSKGDPTSMNVHVSSLATDCSDQPDNLVGMGRCWVKLARTYAPKAIIGFHASQWSDPDPTKTVAFLNAIGEDQADVVFSDLLDRDAGCFEAGTDPNCMRQGQFYWDESNQTSPNFHDYQTWSKAITSGTKRPMIWWQIPFGVPSATPGGTAGHYRDNRVHYIFSHIDEWVSAGGLGVAFGTGAANQTYIDTDGDQFKDAITAYYQKPIALP
jgi:hypothetical protein